MSAHVKNVESFMENHEERFSKEKKKQTLEKAQSIAKLNGGLIVSGKIKEIFDDSQMTNLFFKEIQSPEHIQIFSEENFKPHH